MPLDVEVSWGPIRLLHRFPVTHEYLTFGGHLSAARVDGSTIAVFTSPVPLLRRGGEAQLCDEGTDPMAAFLARLVAAVDLHPGLGSRLAVGDPFVRYSAFLADVARRYRASTELRTVDPNAWTLLRGEESLMRREHAQAWQAGERLLTELQTGRARPG